MQIVCGPAIRARKTTPVNPCVVQRALTGVDLRTIRVWLGHASLASTSRYLHVTRKTLDAVHSPFDRLTLSTPPAAD
jgi:integrase